MSNILGAVDDNLGFLKNQYVSAILMIILISYAGIVVPNLPAGILKYLDNIVVKFIFFFLIAYMTQHNIAVSLVASIAFLVTLEAINKYKLAEHMANIKEIDSLKIKAKHNKLPKPKVSCSKIEVNEMNDSPEEGEYLTPSVLEDINKSGSVKSNFRNSSYHQYTNQKKLDGYESDAVKYAIY